MKKTPGMERQFEQDPFVEDSKKDAFGALPMTYLFTRAGL
jgi:hypothetical protein